MPGNMVWKLFQMKEPQVAAQQRGKNGLLVHLRAFVPERAPGFEAGSSAERPVAEVIAAAANSATYAARMAWSSAVSCLGLSGLVVVEAQRKLKQAI